MKKGLWKKTLSASFVVSILLVGHSTQSIANSSGQNFSASYKRVASQFSVTNIVVLGVAKVGQTMSVDDVTVYPSWGEWDARFYLDGTFVGASTEYLFKPKDFNKKLTIQITARIPICCTVYINPPKSVTVNWSGSPTVQAGVFPSVPIPEISGTGKVGTYLTVDPGDWDSNASLEASWMRDGIVIPGANDTRYLVKSEDFGHTISVQVRARSTGFLDANSKSERIAVTKGELGFKSEPFVSGNFQVGSILQGSFSSSSVEADASIEWLRNGNPISGANSTIYRVTPSDLKTLLSFKVTLSQIGYNQYSNTTLGKTVQLGKILPKSRPVLIGVTKPGRSITAACPKWMPGVKIIYEWYLDGKFFKRTSTGKILVPDKVGRKLSVKVTQSLSGYLPASSTSSTSIIR